MSNCLLEAMRQRILYGYKVYYVKPEKVRLLPHFCWWNNNIESYQHYTSNKDVVKGSELWFRGHVDIFPYEKLKVRLVRIL